MPTWWRLAIAAYLLGEMMATGGVKTVKVKAALEYADLLLAEYHNKRR
jgi:hypothetical protein